MDVNHAITFLHFSDYYGNYSNNIKDITNDKILKEIEFNNGTNKTIDFNIWEEEGVKYISFFGWDKKYNQVEDCIFSSVGYKLHRHSI